jgi:hypothetical protein
MTPVQVPLRGEGADMGDVECGSVVKRVRTGEYAFVEGSESVFLWVFRPGEPSRRVWAKHWERASDDEAREYRRDTRTLWAS